MRFSLRRVATCVSAHLHAIRQDITILKGDERDTKVRFIGVAEGLAGVHRRPDRVDAQVEQIEAHLTLVEA